MPRQLVLVANRPILHYVMDQIAGCGIWEVGVILAPETAEQVRAALEANPWGFELTFITQEAPLGLAHAVKVARGFLEDQPSLTYLGGNLVGDTTVAPPGQRPRRGWLPPEVRARDGRDVAAELSALADQLQGFWGAWGCDEKVPAGLTDRGSRRGACRGRCEWGRGADGRRPWGYRWS